MKDIILSWLDKVTEYVTSDYRGHSHLAFHSGRGMDEAWVAQEISELDFWRPIETAPKDGTWIQAWAEDGLLGYITYCSNYGIWVTNVDNVFDSKCYPTKWQPLPNPPKQ
jgi:hypothetical protein